LVGSFKSQIREAFLNESAGKKRNESILLTTSKILSDPQLLFVCKEIENLREISDRGYNQDVLHYDVLPRFIIHTFKTHFNLSEEEALVRIKTQEEYQDLFLDDEMNYEQDENNRKKRKMKKRNNKLKNENCIRNKNKKSRRI
jgi:hypothetical protein